MGLFDWFNKKGVKNTVAAVAFAGAIAGAAGNANASISSQTAMDWRTTGTAIENVINQGTRDKLDQFKGIVSKAMQDLKQDINKNFKEHNFNGVRSHIDTVTTIVSNYITRVEMRRSALMQNGNYEELHKFLMSQLLELAKLKTDCDKAEKVYIKEVIAIQYVNYEDAVTSALKRGAVLQTLNAMREFQDFMNLTSGIFQQYAPKSFAKYEKLRLEVLSKVLLPHATPAEKRLIQDNITAPDGNVTLKGNGWEFLVDVIKTQSNFGSFKNVNITIKGDKINVTQFLILLNDAITQDGSKLSDGQKDYIKVKLFEFLSRSSNIDKATF
jgi:hypothetical protein